MTNKAQHAVCTGMAGIMPAFSISAIHQKESGMSNVWPFLAGVVVGATGIIVAAHVVDSMANSGGDDALEEDEEQATDEDQGESSNTTHRAEDFSDRCQTS